MYVVRYKDTDNNSTHTEEAGSRDDAYRLMKEINSNPALRGITVTGAKHYFCGMTGAFYVIRGRRSFVIGQEEQIGV